MTRRSVSSCVSPGTARADAALGAREVRPQARQARQLVLELGQLDLEAAFVGPRVLGEDVEDQAAPIEHLDAQQALERLLLVGLSSSSAMSSVKPVSCLARDELLGLALAHVPVGIDVAPVLPLGADHFRAGRVGQAGQLGRATPRPSSPRPAGVDRDQEGTLERRRELDQPAACVHAHSIRAPA